MVASAAVRRSLTMGRSSRLSRTQFVASVTGIVGSANVTLFWLAKMGDGASVTTLDANARTLTWDASVSGRLTSLGTLAAQSFTSGSSQFGTVPDTASLSFGNSINDTAVSIAVLCNVTDTAVARSLFTKWDSGNVALEYAFNVTAADLLAVSFRDQSATVSAVRASNAAITQGSWRLFGFSYTGAGGATAADGITLYDNGSVLASTPTNNAAYVAMENLSEPPCIGAISSHTSQYLDGSMAMVLICTTVLSATQWLQLRAVCARATGLSLP